MNTALSLSPASLATRPHGDLLEQLLRALGRGLLRAAEARHRARQRRAERRQGRLAEQLSPALLRDIGAPDWLQLEARAWRQAENLRQQALRQQAAGGL
ncbi:MAG: hypothetical protein KBC73_14000 [Burkholderiaceae bacterium]|nr:hypothetical protein [Burkholderiaceae bacterium]